MKSRRVSFSSEADCDAVVVAAGEASRNKNIVIIEGVVAMSPEPSLSKKAGKNNRCSVTSPSSTMTSPTSSPFHVEKADSLLSPPPHQHHQRTRLVSTDSYGDASSIATDTDVRLDLFDAHDDDDDVDEDQECCNKDYDSDDECEEDCCSSSIRPHHCHAGCRRHGHARDHHGRSEDDMDGDVSGSATAPPDGGWGWAVVFASFMIHIVTDGVTYTFGNFFPEFLKHFENSRSNTSWIISIMAGVTFGSGPLVSALSNKYDCQKVSIAGAVLASACLFASSYAVNITTLYVTIGLGTGLGLGFIYLPAIVMVTTYFEKKRAFATGIAVCGSGMGTLIFAPLTEYLIAQHGWRWALSIVAALVLSCTLFAAIFRPLQEKDSDTGHSEDDDELRGGTGKTHVVRDAFPEVVIDAANDHERKISAGTNISQDQSDKGDSAYQSSVSSNDPGPDLDDSTKEDNNMDSGAENKGEHINMDGGQADESLLASISPNKRHAWQKNPRLKHLGLGGISDSELAKSLPTLEQSTPVHGREKRAPSSNRSSLFISARRRASSEAHHNQDDAIRRHPAGATHFLKPPLPHSHERSTSSLATRKNLGFGLEATGMLASIAHLDHCHHHTRTPEPRQQRRHTDRRITWCHHSQYSQSNQHEESTVRMAKSAEPPARDNSSSDTPVMPMSPAMSHVGDGEMAASRASIIGEGKLKMKLSKVAKAFCPKDITGALSGMLSFAVLKDPIFLLYTVSNFITSVGYIVPYCFLVDRAHLELNIVDSQTASNILGCVGIASMAGRLIFGFAADRVCFNRLWLYTGCVATFGIATFCCPWAMDEFTLTVYAVVFGATSGAYVGLGSVILVDLMSTAARGVDDTLVNAFGILLLFQGIATTIAPPIGGWVTDLAGRSNYTFHLAGGLVVISAVMLLFTPHLLRKRDSMTTGQTTKQLLIE